MASSEDDAQKTDVIIVGAGISGELIYSKKIFDLFHFFRDLKQF